MKNEETTKTNRRRGRPPKPLADKPRIFGKVRVMLDPEKEMIIPVDAETRVLAQRLMLREWPGVETVEQLFAYAVQVLAARRGMREDALVAELVEAERQRALSPAACGQGEKP